ncbi:hypothetical protein RJT34_15947 [Clitoria ternatea]|uniref:Uncharacterized protein n=1 Tax=Clitoria ternatea TaxID=43366 RepID=A0AAN9J7U2_CLITE
MEGTCNNPRKRKLMLSYDEDDDDMGEVCRFKILLPNGTSVELTLCNPEPEMPFGDFMKLVKDKYLDSQRTSMKLKKKKKKRDINWNGGSLFLQDANDTEIRNVIKLKNFKPNKCHILRLHDGGEDVASFFENMWDLTPDADMLLELPEEYTFETALADLIPYFGMFGYGGPTASMHLGRRASVSSKTKHAKKVYMLLFEREALLSTSGTKLTWKTDGAIRDPSKDEIRNSHGSFTKVEIYEPNIKEYNINRLQCHLKDIYFPYIQSDDMSESGKTITPIEFQVNNVDLAEIHGGEVAITNLHSCNGPQFVIHLKLSFSPEHTSIKSASSTEFQKANAFLRFVYFPFREGKENIDRILEQLMADGCEVSENFERFSRVSIRRLGRLLPDARWVNIEFKVFLYLPSAFWF